MAKVHGVPLKACYEHSFCLSADVCAAFDPNFPEVFEAGTASSSAEMKSASTMPYFWLRISMMASFTRSEPSSSLKGRDPTSRLSCSPADHPTHTAVCMLADKEEIGSTGILLEGTGPYQQIELLAGNALAEGLLGLLRRQVGQKC